MRNPEQPSIESEIAGENRLAAMVANRFVDVKVKMRLYEEVVDASPVPTIMTSEDGGVIHVNPAYCFQFGVKKEDVLGSGWERVVSKADLSRVVGEWSNTILRKLPYYQSVAGFIDATTGVVQCSFRVVKLVDSHAYVGFIIPMCADPHGCPVHDKLMKIHLIRMTGFGTTIQCFDSLPPVTDHQDGESSTSS